MRTISKIEAEKAYNLARGTFLAEAKKQAKKQRYNLSGQNHNYRELYIYYLTLKEWKQIGFSSEGYNNIINREDLMNIVSQIHKLKTN